MTDGTDFDLECRLSNLWAHDTNALKWGMATLPSTPAMGCPICLWKQILHSSNVLVCGWDIFLLKEAWSLRPSVLGHSSAYFSCSTLSKPLGPPVSAKWDYHSSYHRTIVELKWANSGKAARWAVDMLWNSLKVICCYYFYNYFYWVMILPIFEKTCWFKLLVNKQLVFQNMGR